MTSVQLSVPTVTAWSQGVLVNTVQNASALEIATGQTSGTWQIAVSLSPVTMYWKSSLSWTATGGAGTGCVADVSINNGTTWSSVLNGAALALFSDAQDLSDVSLLVRLTLSRALAGDPTPTLSSIALAVTDSPESTKRMLTYLPEPMRGGSNIRNHLRGAGAELDLLYDALAKSEDNLHPDTATFKLSAWEAIFGLDDGSALTDVQRQTRIAARLAGSGVCNRKRIEDLCASYEPNTLYVIEDPFAAQVWIRFIGTKGDPVLLADLQLAVRQQLPENVGPMFDITYIDWDTRDAQNRTWTQVDALGRTWEQRDVNP